MKPITFRFLEALGDGGKTVLEVIQATGIRYQSAYQAAASLKKSGHIEVCGYQGGTDDTRGKQILKRSSKPWHESANNNPCITVNTPRELKTRFQTHFPNMAEEIRRLMIKRLEEVENQCTEKHILDAVYIEE